MMLRYISFRAEDDGLIDAIDAALTTDSATRSHKANCRHLFLHRTNGPMNKLVSTRPPVVERFCVALRDRMMEIPVGDRDEQLVRPLNYIGYASSSRRRKTEH